MNPKVKETLDRIRQEAIAKVQASRRKIIPITPEIENLQRRYDELEKKYQAIQTKQLLPNLTIPERLTAEITGELTDAAANTLRNFNGEIAKAAACLNVPELNGNFYIYPEGCRFTFFPSNSKAGVVVVEQAPQFRTISNTNARYHLPLPYVIFIIHLEAKDSIYKFHRLHVGFSPKSIQSMSDQLYAPSLANFTSHHTVCMGGFTSQSRSYCEVVNETISSFWQSRFTSNRPWFKYKRKIINNYEVWENLDLLEILKAQFQQGSTVEELIRISINNPPEIRSLVSDIISESYRKILENLDVSRVTQLIQSTAEEILKTENIILQSEVR